MSNFKIRRSKLMEKIKDNSLVILFSNSIRKASEDSDYPFVINRNFFYLTNISQDNSTLLLMKGKENREIMFVDEYNESKEKWYGKKLSIKEVNELSKIEEVEMNSTFISKIETLLKENEIENIYLDLKSDEKFVLDLKEKYKGYHIFDAYPLIRDLRLIKDEEEIKNIKEAISITYLGLKRIIKELKSSKYEYEIYNAFNHEILNHGTHELGFPSIIASGINTCCLHYPTPLDKLDKNSLILCDVGSAYNHYSSDITRTFPISGKFNEFQKKIYEIVLSCNKKVIEKVSPNVTLKELQNFAKSYLASECIKIGLIKEVNGIDKYYFHGVSHFLGLDTHDVGDRERKLEVGNVITVEPGLYIKEKETGVRIEDDVLVTSSGHEVLSKEIVKEVNDIEKLFS